MNRNDDDCHRSGSPIPTTATGEERGEEVARLRQQLDDLSRQYLALLQRMEKQRTAYEQRCACQTATERALALAKVIVDRSPVILFRRVAGEEAKLEFVSDNIRQLGYTPEEFLSNTIMFKDIVHPEDQDRVRDEINAFAEEDVEEYQQSYRLICRSGEVRWVEDTTTVVRDDSGQKTHNQGVLIDVTERRLAEEALRKSEEKYRRIVETAGEGFVMMDRELRITDVNEAYCRLLGYSREELLGKTPFALADEETRRYMESRREEFLAMEYREFEGTLLARGGKKVPVLIHGNTLRDDAGNAIGNVAFVTDMTAHKRALVLAGEVQRSLLPQSRPEIVGLDIAGRNVSCEEIGGDYYDFLWQQETGDGQVSVVVGDISGHGVDSALLMTTARAFLRMRASQPGSISEIVTAMNRHLCRDVFDSGRFMTMFYLSVQLAEGRLEWVRAGHDPALLYDPATDSFTELKGEGVALGLTDCCEYRTHTHTGLASGQLIAVGTDGIWETFNTAGEMYGKERFRQIVRASAHQGASAVLDAVFSDLVAFSGGRKAEDDSTLVVIQVGGGPE